MAAGCCGTTVHVQWREYEQCVKYWRCAWAAKHELYSRSEKIRLHVMRNLCMTSRALQCTLETIEYVSRVLNLPVTMYLDYWPTTFSWVPPCCVRRWKLDADETIVKNRVELHHLGSSSIERGSKDRYVPISMLSMSTIRYYCDVRYKSYFFSCMDQIDPLPLNKALSLQSHTIQL